MKQNRTFLLMALAVLFFAAAGMRHTHLLRARVDYGINAFEPLENAPPLMAFTTVLLGGFRGLMADALWLRISSMQDKGRYFEVIQLADWVTKLEPRNADIWAYQAWNMAYNISSMMPDDQDRWRWVQNGLHLLRDEGLMYNPAAGRLYYEIGWMFQHKIGGVTDPAHLTFKMRWAEEMHTLFGGGHLDYDALFRDPQWRRRVEQDYRLDLETLQRIDYWYGPLDWRRPEPHALYWAIRGAEYARGHERLNCDRMAYQAMIDLFLNGRLFFNSAQGRYLGAARLDLFPKVVRMFEQVRRRNPDVASIGMAYSFFLQRAVQVMHAHGEREAAKQIYTMLQDLLPPEAVPPLDELLAVPGTYDLYQEKRQLVQARVEGYLYQGFFRLAEGDQNAAEAWFDLAETQWQTYLGLLAEEQAEKLGMPKFDELYRLVLGLALADADPEASAVLLEWIEAVDAKRLGADGP